MSQLAIVQRSPVFLDKTKTIEAAVAAVAEAKAKGAELVVFTEAFIPGYPTWIWRLRPGGDWDLSEQLHQRLLKNAVNLGSDDLVPLYQAAKKHQVTTGASGHGVYTEKASRIEVIRKQPMAR